MQPLGAKVLCRSILTEETFPGTRIIATDERRSNATAQQAEVLEVGPGERDADGDFVPMDPDLKPGAWVLHTFGARVHVDDLGPYDETFVIHAKDIVAIIKEST